MKFLTLSETSDILGLRVSYITKHIICLLKTKKKGRSIMIPEPDVLNIKNMSYLDFIRFISKIPDAITTENLKSLLGFLSTKFIWKYKRDGKLPKEVYIVLKQKVYSLNDVMNHIEKHNLYYDEDYYKTININISGLLPL